MSRVKSLGGDFQPTTSLVARTSCLLFGDTGCGKTTFALKYAPDPIALINLDGRAGYAVRDEVANGREIHACYLDDVVDTTNLKPSDKKACDRLVAQFDRNFDIACERAVSGRIRTAVIDTATELNSVFTISVRGHLGKAKDYGKSKHYVDEKWWSVFKRAKRAELNLVILARAKEIWAKNSKGNNESTGANTFRCTSSVINEGADWSGEVSPILKSKSGSVKGWQLRITKSGVNIGELGKVYTTDDEEWEAYGGFALACIRQYPQIDDPDAWL